MQRDTQNYIIIEMQTSGASTAIVTPQTFTDLQQATHAFLLAEAAAVISSVPIHTVYLLTDDGKLARPPACYIHEVTNNE